MEQLRTVARRQAFRCLEFEHGAGRHHEIQKKLLAEAPVANLDRNFQLCFRNPVRNLTFVNLFVKKAAQFTMNLENTVHHRVSKITKLGLR